MNGRKIILASSSPRRSKLLIEAGYRVEIFPSKVDENSDEKEPHKLTKLLSKRKAKEVFKKFPDDIIIAADTMVFMDSRLFGKPIDFQEAFEMLSILSGKRHFISTGVTIIYKDKTITFSDEAFIDLNPLTRKQINNFLNNSNPYDKAGAYSVEEIPQEFIKEIGGEKTTILGMPIYLVNFHLKKLK